MFSTRKLQGAGGIGGLKGTLKNTLTSPNVTNAFNADDFFGYSVSLSESYAIVGAYGEPNPETVLGNGDDSGKAFIFSTSTGALLHTLVNPNPYGTGAGDRFGATVGISESYAIVGATLEDDAGGTTSGKAYIYSTTTGALLYTLDNPNAYGTSANDNFASSVDISQNYAIVGAYGEDEAAGNTSGKAYIYSTTTGALLHTLDNPNAYGTVGADNFGYSASISNTYAIVGAYLEDDAGGNSSGKAYIFNPSTGALLHTLNNPDASPPSTNDWFAYSVSIDDTRAIVGAVFEDDAGGTSSGKAYIFNASTGALLYTLDNPNPFGTSASDSFGRSVDISGSYAIVGAEGEDDAGGTTSGKAYIFSTTTGALLHTLDNPNAFGTSSADYFGLSVAISNSYAIGGAYQEDEPAEFAYNTNSSGKAYIFNTSTGALVHTLDNPSDYGTTQENTFGYSVAVSNSYVIVGAYQEDTSARLNDGNAYIYNASTGSLLFTLTPPSGVGTSTSNHLFGTSVDICESYAIVGAPNADNASGKAFIYSTSTGVRLHTLNNPNSNFPEGNFDQFGYSVGISENYAIVGVPYMEGSPSPIGADSGSVHIYNPSTGVKLHDILNPNAYSSEDNDYFGYSVSISDTYAIVGAYSEDDAGGNASGKAYIFNPSTGALLYTLDNPNAYGTSAGDYFGYSVSISDSYAIVGAHLEDDDVLGNSGKAYIFNPSTGALLYTLDNPNAFGTSASDSFGRSVGISNSYAIVGAYLEDDAGGSDSGKAYIYDNLTGDLLYTLDNPNAYGTSSNDIFGRSVSISNTYAIVGAYQEDDASGNSAGAAYVFK